MYSVTRSEAYIFFCWIFYKVLMYIDRKNKKLGIISLSYKQWNVDVDFVKIVFYIKLIEEIGFQLVIKNNLFWCLLLYLLQYEYQDSLIALMLYLSYFTSSTFGVLYSKWTLKNSWIIAWNLFLSRNWLSDNRGN